MLMVAKYFFIEMTMNDMGKRAHVLKHLHRSYVVGDFDIILHKSSIWNGHRAVLYIFSYTNLHFLTLYIMVQSL